MQGEESRTHKKSEQELLVGKVLSWKSETPLKSKNPEKKVGQGIYQREFSVEMKRKAYVLVTCCCVRNIPKHRNLKPLVFVM